MAAKDESAGLTASRREAHLRVTETGREHQFAEQWTALVVTRPKPELEHSRMLARKRLFAVCDEPTQISRKRVAITRF
jgi:hypothetical protein